MKVDVNSILIRPVTEADNAAIEKIIRDVMAEFDADPHTTIIGDPSIKNMFACYQESRSMYYVLEIAENICGGCGIRKLDGGDNSVCELQRMFILPECRGQGLGRMLIGKCLQTAVAFGYKKIYIETLSQMKKAIALYEAYGFRKIDKALGNTGHTGCNVHMLRELGD